MRLAAIICPCGFAACGIVAWPPTSQSDADQTRCASVCAERAEKNEQEAWCPIDWRAELDCEPACMEARSIDPEVGAAFEACATTNPLCYELLDTCMLRELFPGPVAQSIRVIGRDLGAFEGHTVWLADADDPDAPQQQAAVAQGGIDYTWLSAPRPVDWTVRVHFAIDVDGDGACEPSTDRVGTASGELVDVTVPAWELNLDPETGSGDCRGFGMP